MSFFFIQMADPQFGLFAYMSGLDEAAIVEIRKRHPKVGSAPKVISGFADETRLYERAIAEANRLRPDFVVMCGDMVQDWDDPDQLDALRRITGKLSAGIPMHWVAGNHDVGNDVTPEALATYRDRFGEDNYSFGHDGSRFIVLNSNVAYDPSEVPHEWEQQLDFLKTELTEARAGGNDHIVVFMHHPLFLKSPDEEDTIFVIPKAQRRVLLDMLLAHGVSAVFAGHYHGNSYTSVAGLQMVTSGSVGYPLRRDPSGFRTVKVFADRIEHDYYGFDAMPDAVELE